MKFSSKVLKCGLSPMRKFHPYAVAAEAKGRKIYHLNIGQPDIETPKAYFDAVKHFDLPVLAYAPSPGIPELIEAIRKYYADLGMHFDAGDILITNGGSEALQITMNCILDDGDEILIPEPFYPNYNTMAYTCGAKIHPIPTSPHDGYHYADRAKVEAEINEHTRAIMVTNPGNPTGCVLTPEEMRMMVDIAKAHDLFIIGDEAYREFVYAGEPLQSMGQFEDAAENVIVIDTVSKRFSACGARIGCMISRNKELMAQAMKYAQCRLSVPTLDQVAAAALYTVGPDYFAAVREEYKRRRDTVIKKLHEIPGVVCECPRGAFYVMAALPVDDADTFQKWLLEEFEDNGDTVMFAPGEPFYGTPGKGKNEIRIAYVLKQADLERAMDLLSRVGVAEQADKVPAQLSGGQQQRVAIARSLAMQPKAMLFDEPTSALDPEMINEVLEVMVRLAQQGMTMIVITHEMNFARRVADRVVFMADGQIVETGTPDEFFDHPQTKRAQDFLNSIKGH